MEMMVVVAVLGILTAIAVPNIVSWRNNSMVGNAVRTLKHDLSGVKSKAITDNATAVVVFSGNGYMAFLDNGATPNNLIREADERVILNKRLTTVSLKKTDFSGDLLTFSSRGICSENGEIVLEMTGIEKRVAVTRVGRITIP